MSESAAQVPGGEQTQMVGGRVEVKYPMTEEKYARIDRDSTYHPPKDDQPERYLSLRESARQFEIHIFTNTPASREQSLALTHLENAVFYAIAAIARNE